MRQIFPKSKTRLYNYITIFNCIDNEIFNIYLRSIYVEKDEDKW